jgi:hypothetical protein
MIPVQNSVLLNTAYLVFTYLSSQNLTTLHALLHELQTDDDWTPISSQPKFISQSQIHTPLNCLKSLVLCRNNGWLMKNHGPRNTQRQNMCWKFNWKYPKYPIIFRPICPNWPIIWDIFEKSSLQMSMLYYMYIYIPSLSNKLRRKSQK